MWKLILELVKDRKQLLCAMSRASILVAPEIRRVTAKIFIRRVIRWRK